MIWVQPKKLILPRRTLRSQGGFILPSGLGMGGPKILAALLHFDGTNNSTTFADVAGNTWSASGNAKISTADSLFGGAAGLFDGTNDWISCTSSRLALRAGNFCVEGAFRVKGSGAAGTSADLIILDYRTAEPSAQMLITMGGSTGSAANRLSLYVNGANRITSDALTPDTWYRWAVERVSGSTKMYINGTQHGTTYADSNNYSSTTAFIGGRFAATSGDRRSFNGYLDEMRITVGDYRHGGDYTPESGPFPDFG